MTDNRCPVFPSLISDCGATSGKWAYIDPVADKVIRFSTGPLNMAVQDAASIRADLTEARDSCPSSPGSVRIYAAGVTGRYGESLADMVAVAFGLPHDRIAVDTDLAGAAEALLGPGRGIACILGTGSNSCLWDGHRIVSNIRPMGYILGDEGSGAAIGAALLRSAVRGSMPPGLARLWAEAYPSLTYASLVEEVYRRRAGSAFIASFVPFAARNISDPFMAGLVSGCFDRFFTEVIALYPDARSLPAAFTGGVAAAFEAQLRAVAGRRGISISLVASDPLDLLVDRAFGRL